MVTKLNSIYNLHVLTKAVVTIGFFLFLIFFIKEKIYAQENIQSCKVRLESIANDYKGDCKNGWASGQGTAEGIHRYIGNFKDGLPDGQGTYYFSDSTYYIGNFQDGIKEGKGEFHYLTKTNTDSMVK